jgi:SAM-dependent methyltransferase
MPRLARNHDAFGRMLLDQLSDPTAVGFVERDDGYLDTGAGTQYFSGFPDWPDNVKKALRLAKGRMLDLGCGAGRHSLYLQRQGSAVTGIDSSPLAVRTCRRLGLRRALNIAVEDLASPRVRRRLGRFDTVLMLGNNLGLLGSARKGTRLLRALHRITNPGALIIGESVDPYGTRKPWHRAYHARNRRRGRMGGQIRLRVRYLNLSTPWSDYLLLSRSELRGLLRDTGWCLEQAIPGAEGSFVAIIRRV